MGVLYTIVPKSKIQLPLFVYYIITESSRKRSSKKHTLMERVRVIKSFNDRGEGYSHDQYSNIQQHSPPSQYARQLKCIREVERKMIYDSEWER